MTYFSSGFWEPKYFSDYWQPATGGGPILGYVSGSFFGVASFSGTLLLEAGLEGLTMVHSINRGDGLIYLEENGRSGVTDSG